MPTFSRSERIGHQIQRDVSEVLLRRVKDPRVGLVTITRVEVTEDLRQARIYFTTPEGKELKDDIHAGLDSATGFIKSELGKRLSVKRMPQIQFVPDDRYDKALFVADTIAKLEKERGRDENTHE